MQEEHHRSPHIHLAHAYWTSLLRPSDTAIDATCGNGHDTLKLATLLPQGTLIGLDIQPEAIERTETLLATSLPQDHPCQIHLHLQSHAPLPQVPSVRLIVYNLGYLPGSDKRIKTEHPSTLASVKNALTLIPLGGAITITCYPGHPEGKEEEERLLHFLATLPSIDWCLCYHQWINRPNSPTLFFIQNKSTTPTQKR